MKAILIEDKEHIRKGLRRMLEMVAPEIQIVGECGTVSEAVIVAQACTPELVFLDINLPDGTGFDFLEGTETLDFKVIFITAYEEYALRALKMGAVDYLLKPVDLEELKAALLKVAETPVHSQKQAINTAKKAYENQGDTLILSLQDSYQIIDLNELVFCESDKGYTTFYLENGKKYLTSKTIKEYEEHLLNFDFTRPHQSFMVNLKFIDKYDKAGTIYLKNGKKIPVSSRKRESFLSHLFNWNKK
ncbi:LytR/AlgR family response regulator transcription factor [Sediminicola luteus]|uniref:DNA-binding response regulator n=1 Tax=Sediminicola luteus TaxID=319238 RepID=A0A2A4GE80_9FLAO|nr:LytTR family DNA-binding domain-containing protein [Sediminicola luteus]PCE66052.1 DNA-binding response regulator [Sediminicola luteus]